MERLNFSYEHKKFLSDVRRLCIVEYLMTNNIYYYETIDETNLHKFCKEKDIGSLPSKHSNLVYVLQNSNFIKREIKHEEKLKITDHIFDKDVLESFTEASPIKYVYKDDVLEGIVHFSDYNRSAVKIYLYGVISEFENNLRSIFISTEIKEESVLEYIKRKAEKDKKIGIYEGAKKRYESSKNKSYPFESFDLIHLLWFYNHNANNYPSFNKINNIGEITKLRNSIMHSKISIELKDFSNEPLVFNFPSFERFRSNCYSVFDGLKTTYNILGELNNDRF